MVLVSLKSKEQSSEDKLNARAARFAASSSSDTRTRTNRPARDELEVGVDRAGGDDPVVQSEPKRIRISSRSRSRLRAKIEKARKAKQLGNNPPPAAESIRPPPPLPSHDDSLGPSPKRAILREAQTFHETPSSTVAIQPAPPIDRPPGNFEGPPGNFDAPLAQSRCQQPAVPQTAPLPPIAQQAPYVQMPIYQPPAGYSAPPVAFPNYGHPVAYPPPPMDMPRGDTGYGPLASGGDRKMRRRTQSSASNSQSPKRKKKRKGKMKPMRLRLKAKPTPEPEPTLEAQALRMSGVLGPLFNIQAFTGWERTLMDEYRRSFVSHRRNAFRASTLQEWYDQLKEKIQWNKPITRKATDDGVEARLPRYACWLTRKGCSCEYEYGGIRFPPMLMPDWFIEITEKVSRACGLENIPNSCNANYYENGDQSVGWHADDEVLFDAKSQDSLIISLSLGQARTFELHPMDEPTKITKLVLQNGDLCTMEGLLQKHYRHRVAREPDAQSPRINLTWRWIRKHQTTCPLSHR